MSAKKFLCITLVLALMVFAFSGCGGSSHNNFSSTNNENQEQEQQQDNQQEQQQDQNQDQQQENQQDQDQNDNDDDNADDNADDNTGDDNNDDASDYDYSSTTAGENAILADGEDESYSDVTVYKSGNYSGSEEADFYGTNAAILALNGATLTLSGITVTTEGSYANGVFCYGGSSSSNGGAPAMPGRISATGDGSTVNISDSTITTSSNNSGGIMVTGGGVLTASNLTITTSGGSSAAIRSDRGGGTMTVKGGTYTTSGTGSPAIYCTADISVSDATLKSTTAQGVVIEGKNSVTLNDCAMTVDNTTINGSQSTRKQAVMIYQSGSGDASTGKGEFDMSGGSITNNTGDIFYITNTTAEIDLSGVTITNNDSSGVFLRAELAGWSTTNGGTVELTADNQTITGDFVIDSASSLTLELEDSSTMTGAINTANSGASVSVSIEAGSTWTLTGNSYVTSLTNNGTINKGSYTLYVNGTAQ
ncbi:MAG: hypothetical protein II917_01900 [Synergistaceae bacterium]|nr:hypothetical protein [Synergistaceae bacterium]